MSFIDCIMSNTVLDSKVKEGLVKEYEKMLESSRLRFGNDNGPIIAATRFMEQEVERRTLKKLNIARDLNSAIKNAEEISVETAAIKDTKKKAGKLAATFLWRKSDVATAVGLKLERLGSKASAEYQMHMRAVNPILDKYASKMAGFKQDVQGFKDIVAEMRGKNTGNTEASKAARDLSALVKTIHEEFRAAGGVIGELKNYFPQRDKAELIHSLVKKHGGDEGKAFAEYLADKKAFVDRRATVDPRTGYALNDEEFAAAAKEIFDETLRYGVDDVDLITRRMTDSAGGMLAERKSSSRFFHYKDADAFFANNSKYGGGDASLFDNFVDYVQAMSRDIAVMQELGPHSDLQFARMLKEVEKDGANLVVAQSLQGMYDIVAGRNAYGGAIAPWVAGVENMQNLLRMSQLGGAIIPAISDSLFVAMTAKYNGLEGGKTLGKVFKLLNPLDASDRTIAANHALVSETLNANSLAMAKHGDVSGTGAMRFGANAVMRSSGLGIWTQMVRSSVVMETQSFMAIAQKTATEFSKLPSDMIDSMGRFGIGEAEYKAIMRAQSIDPKETGAALVTPNEVWKIDKSVARKYGAWLYDMSQVASNEPRLLTRAITTGAALGGAKRGSGLREISSTIMMYKAYGITVMLNHLLPALRRGAVDGKWGRVATIMAVAPLMAAATMQARSVIYGKTPEDMDKPAFWVKSFAASGVFGPFSDTLLADSTRYDYNLADSIIGPAWDLGTGIAKLTGGNLIRAVDPEQDTQFAKDAAKLFQQYSPKIAYTRLLQERLVYDQLNRMADPTYDSRMIAMEKKMMKEKGQEFWYRP